MSRRKRLLRSMAVLLAVGAVPAAMVYRLRLLDQHERALITAVRTGDIPRVEAELRWGIDPNTRDVPNAPTDWREYFKRLWRHQPLPNRQQYTPALLIAERNRFHAVARLLLRAGADPNATDSTGEHPLMLALGRSQEEGAARKPDAETALLMLAKGADPNTHDANYTALEAALNAHQREVARQLILRGAAVNAPNPHDSPLLALADFDLQLTELMLSKGADVNAVDAEDYTVLMQADQRVTPLLLAHGANVHAKNTDGVMALRVACERDERKKVPWLLRYGADCSPAHNGGWNLLCWSVAHGEREIARIAQQHGIGVNTRDGFRRTPLMFAASNGDVATLRQLLARGANVNAQDKAGMTALMYAAQTDKTAVVQLLLQHGANAQLRDKEHRWTAAERAAHFGCENAADWLRTGKLPPPLPADTNPKGETKPARVRVDANRWLVRTPLAGKDDPSHLSNEYVKAYIVRLEDEAGRKGATIVVHYYEQAPAMFSFRDVDGRRYVYVEEREDTWPGGAIYLAKGLRLSRKWSDMSRFGIDCTPIPHGGALMRRYSPGHYHFGFHNPRTHDSTINVFRFRNGAVKELGTMDTPDE